MLPVASTMERNTHRYLSLEDGITMKILCRMCGYWTSTLGGGER